MSYERHIPWFNPREMDDNTVRTLSTGRDELLEDFFKAVCQRLSHPGPGVHWLVTGPRGAGKSYFLRLVQANFSQALSDRARFVLLPEEHSNISSPHELLQEIKRMLNVDKGDLGLSSAWRVKDEEAAWTQALSELMAAWTGPLLVIGVENFDRLMQQAFDNDVRNARLRTLLAHEPRLMFLATAVQGEFDEDYQKRFFRQFEHHDIPKWDDEAHRCYLQRRAGLQGKKTTPHQLARIKAYSRYTGGNARVAAVLAGAILDEQDPLLACADLNATLDRMTDYYRALFERIPPNTRKLFDALIRGGEPSSQTEIAERVGARQSDISRAFAWLIDYGYVREDREKGRKERRYLVTDRLFVQFYRMRYLQPGQRTQLSLLADLLADTIEFSDKWRHAERYLNDGYENEARTMAELACRERGVDLSLLTPEARETARLIQMGRGWDVRDAIVEAGDGDQPDDAAWDLGQIARHTIRQTSVDAAWSLLDELAPDRPAYRIKAWQQLGDAVWDCSRLEGDVKAFALGCNLLEGLANRPKYPAEDCVRALWVNMIDMGVPHALLRDLLGEVLRIFADNNPNMQMLCTVLFAWLDDLDCAPSDRAKRRKALDPDLATTLEALGQNLSPAARARLNLDG